MVDPGGAGRRAAGDRAQVPRPEPVPAGPELLQRCPLRLRHGPPPELVGCGTAEVPTEVIVCDLRTVGVVSVARETRKPVLIAGHGPRGTAEWCHERPGQHR